MEIALPLLALGSLYAVASQRHAGETRPVEREGFSSGLPNVNMPDKNYPDDTVDEYVYDRTSTLAQLNRYGNGVGDEAAYTDKYFRPSTSVGATGSSPMELDTSSATYYTSMTGEEVPSSHFHHGNMVPFFGGKIRGPLSDANGFEGMLDSYTGAGSQQINKREQAPLFEPLDNMEMPFGMAGPQEFIQSRVMGNLGMKQNGARPFEPTQVAPAVIDRAQYMDPTVDDLRVRTNPKASEYSLMGRETAPKYFNNALPTAEIQGRVEKNRPDTAFEMDHDRLFTTTGAYLKPGEAGQILDRETHRNETARDYMGNAGAKDMMYTTGEYLPSRAQQLGAMPTINLFVEGTGAAVEGEYGLRGQGEAALPNNRTANYATSNSDYFGAVGGIMGAVVAPIMDAFRPTRKGAIVGNARIYGDAGSRVPATYVYEQDNNTPLPTNRDMRRYDAFDHAQINRGQAQGTDAYNTLLSNGGTALALNPTARAGQHTSYIGSAGSGGFHQPTSYESAYAQKNNEVKQTTITGFTPGGGTNLFSGAATLGMDTAAAANARYEARLVNDRPVNATRGTVLPPAVDSMGASSDIRDTQTKWKKFNEERQNKDILAQFANNPYTHDIAAFA